MGIEVIFADFDNADEKGRLNTNRSFDGIKNYKIELVSGKKVLIDESEKSKTIGTFYFSTEGNIWVAEINWDDIQQEK